MWRHRAAGIVLAAMLYALPAAAQEKVILEPEPPDDQLTPPLDGFATKAKVQSQHAVNFIIDTVKKYPRQVTLVAIGPVTNLALAIRLAPEIVPLIKRIIYMGGAFEVRASAAAESESDSEYLRHVDCGVSDRFELCDRSRGHVG